MCAGGWGSVATALQRGGPLTIKRADMHMRRLQCVGSLQSAATMLYIAEIISRSDWTVINGISLRGFNAVTPRAVDNFSKVPGSIYDMGFRKSDACSRAQSCSFAAKRATPHEEAYIVLSRFFRPPPPYLLQPHLSLFSFVRVYMRTINSAYTLAVCIGDNVFIYCS